MSRALRWILFACCCVIFSGDVRADGRSREENQCRKDAQRANRTCESACRVELNTALGTCSSRDPSCVRDCRIAHRACDKSARESLNTCRDACEPALRAARTACRTECACERGDCPKNRCFRECVNSALVADFVCKQSCLDEFLLNPEAQANLEQCKETKRTCLTACGVAAGGGD